MEIEITARATGPYGELNRRQRITDRDMPASYLNHLVDIGVARYVVQHRIEKKIETKTVEPKKEAIEVTKKTSSASQPAQALPEKTPKKRRGRQRKSS